MQAQPSIKDAALSRAWAAIKQAKPDDSQGLPSKTWAAMSPRVKTVLVMLGATSAIDPREAARRPWGSLSEEDRTGIAACAKEMSRNLRDAACLF